MKEVPLFCFVLFCFVFFSIVYYEIDKTEITGPGRHIGYRHMHQRLRMSHDLPIKRYTSLIYFIPFFSFKSVEEYMLMEPV